MKTSYSALETFGNCPLKYKYQEIEKIRAPKRIEAVFGTLIHSALEYMFSRAPLFPSEEEVVDHFTRSFADKSEAVVWAQPERKNLEEKKYLEFGVNLLRNFYRKNPPWQFSPVELESRFSVSVLDEETGETHQLSGVIDRVDKNPAGEIYEIIDYKTGKSMPSAESLAENLQLGLYALAILSKWPNLTPDKIVVSLYYVKHNEKISLPGSAERLIKNKQTILAKIKELSLAIEKEAFPPKPSPLCDYCEYRKICPMWRHEYKRLEAPSVDEHEAQTAVAEFFDLKDQEEAIGDRLDNLRETIVAYMDKEGVERVFGERGYIGRTKHERITFDLEKMREILEKDGCWEKILSPDDKLFQNIFDSLSKETKEALAPFIKKKTVAMIKASKKKGTEQALENIG